MALTDDSVSIDDPVLHSEERLAIVLGTEGDGLHEQTIDSCDYTVKIPMSHGVDSLNVAAASAVAFWELAKRLMRVLYIVNFDIFVSTVSNFSSFAYASEW